MSLNGTGAKEKGELGMAAGLGSGPDEGHFAIVSGLIALMIGLIKSGICVFGGENWGRDEITTLCRYWDSWKIISKIFILGKVFKDSQGVDGDSGSK